MVLARSCHDSGWLCQFLRALGLDADFFLALVWAQKPALALIADQGKVTDLAVEQPGAFDVSSAETVLSKL